MLTNVSLGLVWLLVRIGKASFNTKTEKDDILKVSKSWKGMTPSLQRLRNDWVCCSDENSNIHTPEKVVKKEV